jgi:hypothetical protein
MAYDHRAKAGNQGDVVKHVALFAMARHAIDATRSVFRYADAYAGPAGSVLLPGGEWVHGVGKVNRSGELNSPDVLRWIRWYLARPQLVGSRYPGSALIVSDIATEAERSHEMTLWDISCDAVADLRDVFPGQNIVHEPVDASHRAIRTADFLFIDPPALAEQWASVLSLMAHGKGMLAWLPINAAVNPGSVKESTLSKEQLKQVSALPSTYRTRVLWARGGRTIGCLLVYRASAEAAASVRAAIDEVVSLCSWTRKDTEHFDPDTDVLLDSTSTVEIRAGRDGQVAAKRANQEPDHCAETRPASSGVISLVCGDTHSFWLGHQGTDETKDFMLLRDRLQKSPSKSRICDVSFDGGQTWIPLVLRLVSDEQIAWKGHSASASRAARIRVLIRT